jgi:cyclophilin family peptidyl-prolyl cis-trans isomerase
LLLVILKEPMRSWFLPVFLAAVALVCIIVALRYIQSQKSLTASTTDIYGAPSGQISPAPVAVSGGVSPSGIMGISSGSGPNLKEQKVSNPSPDLSVDTNGLSKATVVMTTNQGVIKYKFYPKDAPNTVNRMIQLINQGFYTGLIFHRVVPGFVIQGGDPSGNGTGGSGQKLKAEFNARRHIEGTLAMARSGDPDSADSQFYISLGTHPHLDHNYTVFGQVIEGMDVAKKIKVGDKMTTIVIE